MCELEWNRVLLTMALNSGADVFMPAFKPHYRRTFLIFAVTQITQNIINCKK